MNRLPTRCVLALSLLVIAFRLAGGDVSSEYRAGGRESADLDQSLWRDLSDGTLDDHDLLQASLIAGGAERSSTLGEAQHVFETFCRSEATSLARCATELERAELLFRAMHEQLLTGPFQSHCYRMDRTLSGESFNCLTSTILYLCLCRSHGISAVAVSGPSHVYCRLQGEAARAIETTKANWSDFGPREPSRATREGVRDPLAQAPPAQASYSDELSDVELIARIYYNRGTSLLLQNEPFRARRYLQRSCQLAPLDRATRDNLVTASNAWALELCDQGRFDEAIAALASCLRWVPGDPTTLQNDLHIHHRWLLALCQQHRFGDALNLLDEGYARQAQVELYDEGRWIVVRDWARWQLQEAGFSAAWQVFTRARQRYGHAPPLCDWESDFWRSYLDQLRQEGRWSELAAVSQQLDGAGRNLTSRDL